MARPASLETMVRKMLADDDLTGNSLLLAIALAEAVTSGNGGGKVWIGHVCQALGVKPEWVRWTIANDRPRYEPPREYPMTCRGQMVRRPGLCGQNATNRFMLWYPVETGESQEIGACSRHRLEVRSVAELSRQRWIAAGKPEPPGNTGGHLEKYFGGDWDVIYRHAVPRWTRPPGGVVRTDMRPVLRLIPGGLATRPPAGPELPPTP